MAPTPTKTRATRKQLAVAFAEQLSIAARKVRGNRKDFDLLAELIEAYDAVKALGDPTATFDAIMQMMPYAFPKRASVALSGAEDGPVQIDLSPVASRLDELVMGRKD
jgi:hypothetical protein